MKMNSMLQKISNEIKLDVLSQAGYTQTEYRLVQQKPEDIWSLCTAVFPSEAGLTTGFCQRDMLENQHLQPMVGSADQCILAGKGGGEHKGTAEEIAYCVSMANCQFLFYFFYSTRWDEQKKTLGVYPALHS